MFSEVPPVPEIIFAGDQFICPFCGHRDDATIYTDYDDYTESPVVFCRGCVSDLFVDTTVYDREIAGSFSTGKTEFEPPVRIPLLYVSRLTIGNALSYLSPVELKPQLVLEILNQPVDFRPVRDEKFALDHGLNIVPADDLEKIFEENPSKVFNISIPINDYRIPYTNFDFEYDSYGMRYVELIQNGQKVMVKRWGD